MEALLQAFLRSRSKTKPQHSGVREPVETLLNNQYQASAQQRSIGALQKGSNALLRDAILTPQLCKVSRSILRNTVAHWSTAARLGIELSSSALVSWLQ